MLTKMLNTEKMNETVPTVWLPNISPIERRIAITETVDMIAQMNDDEFEKVISRVRETLLL